uniref:Uncharacterized protein n=1 Tax=Timema tahoe TaxID=61484 RepID=A0A7R9FL53_9NEOP|nr:unnamed protein product [Timema tahoe]
MAKECFGYWPVPIANAERDGLSAARHELERKLVFRDLELHEKEEELFLQLEKVVRLEEDCEKLPEKMGTPPEKPGKDGELGSKKIVAALRKHESGNYGGIFLHDSIFFTFKSCPCLLKAG